MSEQFNSASEFLSYINKHYANPIEAIHGKENRDFSAIYKERLKREKIDPASFATSENSPYESIAQGIWLSVQEILPVSLLEKLTPIAVGALDNFEMNALCIRSSDGFIAIAVNAGLMCFLNKMSKLSIATAVDDCIMYCNRCSPHEITRAIARSWYEEVAEHYRITRNRLDRKSTLTFLSAAKNHTHLIRNATTFQLA